MNKYFRAARSASLKSDHPTYKIGSVVVCKGKIIATGHNLIKKSHKLTRIFHKYQAMHSEVSALIHCRFTHNLKGAILYVFRQHKDKTNAICRPCCTCIKILQLFGIKKVIYTTDEGYKALSL